MQCIPTAVECQQLLKSPQDELLLDVLQAIYVAIDAGNSTTSAITISPATESNLLGLVSTLRGQGLTVTLSSSTFTVGW